jgi:hypothetical protein
VIASSWIYDIKNSRTASRNSAGEALTKVNSRFDVYRTLFVLSLALGTSLRRCRRGMASGNTPTAMSKQRLPEEK